MHIHIYYRLLILTSQDTASGEIFEQYENADGLVKLLSAINKQLKNLKPLKRLAHAAHLLPMSRVLVMLVSVYEGVDHKKVAREVACAILSKYSDVSSAPSEEVAQVLCNAVSTVELLVLRCGKLTFSADTNTYTASPCPDEDIAELNGLLDGICNDAVFCSSVKKILGQIDCPLRVAGQVSSLLRCLLHADLLCVDAASTQSPGSRVVDRIIILSPSSSSSAGQGMLPDLTRLLEREAALPLPAGGSQERGPAIVAALHRLCAVVGLLRSLLPLLPRPPANLTQQQQQQQGSQDDVCVSRGLMSLGQWLGRGGLGAADLAAAAELKPLLRALLQDSAGLLDGGLGALWPQSSAALTSLLASIEPLRLMLGQGPSQPTATAAEVDAMRTEMDSLRAEIQVLRSQQSSQVARYILIARNDRCM